MQGGLGNDRFIFASGDSGVTAGSLDQIQDWAGGTNASPVDTLVFGATAGSATNYLELTAANYDAAVTAANAQIAGSVVTYVAVQVGTDVVVFADGTPGTSNATDAVVLVGRTLADIDYTNIVT